MRNIKFQTGLALLISLSIFAGCDRPNSNESRVSLSLPSKFIQSKLGNVSKQGQLGHIVINVSGPGMTSPFVFNWDVDNQNPNCSGETCTLVVPAGDNRLIQVLAVYMTTDAMTGIEAMDFQYGDQTKALIAGDNSVNINLSSITSGSVTEAEFGGRYLETATDGPTGKLNISYVPNGKPAVLIMQNEMFGGWFQAMAFKGLPLQYSINGKVILNGDTTSMFDAKLGTSLMQIKWPQYYEEKNSSPSLRPASDQYLGFFGPGVGVTHKVCYPSFTGDVQRAFSGAAVTNSDPKIQWNGNESNITKGFVFSGGISYASDPDAQTKGCADSNNEPKLNAFAINPIDRGIPRLSAPFMKGNELDTSVANQVNWKFLPGAGINVAGFRLYGMPSAKVDEYRSKMSGDGYRCADLEKDIGLNGVFKIADAGAAQRSISFPAIAATSSKILCVKTAFGWANSAARAWGGTNTNNNQANDFNVDMINKVGLGQCHYFRIKLKHTTQNNAFNGTNQTFTVSGTGYGSDFIIYNSLNCQAGSETNTFTISANSMELTGTFKFVNPTTDRQVDFNGMSLNRNHLITAATPSATVNEIRFIETPYKINLTKGDCREIRFMKFDSAGFPTTGDISTNVDRLNLSEVAETDFAVNRTCTEHPIYSNALTNSLEGMELFNNGNFIESVVVKTSPTVDLSNRILKIMSKPIYLNVPDLAHHLDLKLVSMPPYFAGECIPFEVSARNSDGTLNAGVSFALKDIHLHSSFYGTLYSQAGCTGSITVPTLNAGKATYFLRIGDVGTRSEPSAMLEASSVYTSNIAMANFAFSPYPFPSRATQKLVLMADQAPLNTTIDNSGGGPTTWKSFDLYNMGGSQIGFPNYAGSATTDFTPWASGVMFVNSFLKWDFAGPIGPSEEFLITIVFKVNDLASDHTLLVMKSSGAQLNGELKVLSDGKISFLQHDLVTISNSTPGRIVPGVWNSITIKRIGTNLEVRHGTDHVGGDTSWSMPGSDFDIIQIGNGDFRGAVKSLLVDGGTGASALSYWDDTAHINAR